MAGPFESISPLPAEIRKCLMTMATLGVISLVAAGLLWLHITYRLILWKIRDLRFQRQQTETSTEQPTNTCTTGTIDLSLGLAENHYYQARYNKNASDMPPPPPPSGGPKQLERTNTVVSQVALEQGQQQQQQASLRTASTRREKPPNPLLLLIYNLILADVVLSISYLSNISWLRMDGIVAPSSTCVAQGWIVSLGCLTTSGFLFAISVFSYLGIIRGYKAKSRDVGLTCTFVWIMSLFLASLGPLIIRDDTFYGRETNWCWIAEEHKLWRLSIYLWGFPAMIGTCSIYSLIFYRLYQEGRSSRYMPRRRGSQSTLGSRRSGAGAHMTDSNNNNHNNSSSSAPSTPLRPSGHHPAFLIYPCIYTVTGTPLILGSLIPVLERNPIFMGTAGGLLASTGLLDAILWSSIIVFSKREDMVNTGLDQFSFMRTPEGRTLGNIVFVQGGKSSGAARSGGGGAYYNNNNTSTSNNSNSNNSKDNNDRQRRRQSWHSKKEKGWWRLGDRNSSQTNLTHERMPDTDGGIQMEVVTSVVVEGQGSAERHSREQSTDTTASKYMDRDLRMY